MLAGARAKGSTKHQLQGWPDQLADVRVKTKLAVHHKRWLSRGLKSFCVSPYSGVGCDAGCRIRVGPRTLVHVRRRSNRPPTPAWSEAVLRRPQGLLNGCWADHGQIKYSTAETDHWPLGTPVATHQSVIVARLSLQALGTAGLFPQTSFTARICDG